MDTIVPTLIAILGGLITLLGFAGVLTPSIYKNGLSFWNTPRRLIGALAIRFVFGVLFILAAPYCRPETQMAVRLLGMLAVAIAVVMLLLGTDRIQALIHWFLINQSPRSMRLWGLLVILFGGFLIYAGT